MAARAALVLGGQTARADWLATQLAKVTCIAAADGGAHSLYTLRILPDYWAGDGDSADQWVLAWLAKSGVHCAKYPVDKAQIDGHLAWRMLQSADTKEMGAGLPGGALEEVLLLQALGGRLDHQLANLGLLKTVSDYLLQRTDLRPDAVLDHAGLATILTPDEQVTILPPMRMRIYGAAGQHFSLQAYGGPVDNLTIGGAKYEILPSASQMQLAPWSDLTISNQFTATGLAEGVQISWTAGNLLLWVEGECRWQKREG